MTVYVVQWSIPYDSSGIQGVYLAKESAEAEANAQNMESEEVKYWVSEFEVQ